MTASAARARATARFLRREKDHGHGVVGTALLLTASCSMSTMGPATYTQPLLSVLLAVGLLSIRLLAVTLLPVAWCCHNRAATLRSACEAAFQNTVIVPDIPDATLKPGE